MQKKENKKKKKSRKSANEEEIDFTSPSQNMIEELMLASQTLLAGYYDDVMDSSKDYLVKIEEKFREIAK